MILLSGIFKRDRSIPVPSLESFFLPISIP
jgi:hypothetical protein